MVVYATGKLVALLFRFVRKEDDKTRQDREEKMRVGPCSVVFNQFMYKSKTL